jgi:hypothetical protein
MCFKKAEVYAGGSVTTSWVSRVTEAREASKRSQTEHVPRVVNPKNKILVLQVWGSTHG